MNAFTHHNRVIHHDSEHQQKREGGQHVERYTHARQQDKCARVSCGNTEGNPESDLGAETEYQYQEYQKQAQECRGANSFQATLEVLGVVGPQGELGPGRQRVIPLGDPVTDRIGSRENVHGLGAHYLQQHRRLPVQGRQDFVVFKPVHHIGHIGNANRAAIGGLAHDDIAKFLLGVGLVADFQLVGTDIGAHRAGGLVDGASADSIGHLLKGHAVASQSLFTHLNGDFLHTSAEQVYQGNGGQGGGLASQLFCQSLQLALTKVTVHCYPNKLLAVYPLVNLWRFDISRERRNAVDPDFYVVHKA